MSGQEIEKLQAEFNAIYEALATLLGRLNEIQETCKQGTTQKWNPTKVKWEQSEGIHGSYERANPQGLKGSDFDLMLKDLKAHDGKLTRDSLFYWVFNDQATVGRKKRK